MADHDVSKMKVADLKRELKNRGLNVTGNKNELVERLQSALIEGDVFDDSAISEEGLLDDNDDVLNDDELDEETKSYLISTSVQDEDAILSSPKGSTSSKSPETPSETNSGAALANTGHHKKVVLKRKLITSVSLTENETTKSISTSATGSTDSKVMKLSESSTSDTPENESKDSNGNADGGVVKLSQLSMKDRLEMRAKKFGTLVTGDAAKIARAERFGTAASNASASSGDGVGSKVTVKSAADVELLKKRAERFGGSVSNTMVKIELNEKLLKRQERFGATTNVSGKVESKPITSHAATEYAEKAKQRLERFKTTA